jgi:hypothetical protein
VPVYLRHVLDCDPLPGSTFLTDLFSTVVVGVLLHHNMVSKTNLIDADVNI